MRITLQGALALLSFGLFAILVWVQWRCAEAPRIPEQSATALEPQPLPGPGEIQVALTAFAVGSPSSKQLEVQAVLTSKWGLPRETFEDLMWNPSADADAYPEVPPIWTVAAGRSRTTVSRPIETIWLVNGEPVPPEDLRTAVVAADMVGTPSWPNVSVEDSGSRPSGPTRICRVTRERFALTAAPTQVTPRAFPFDSLRTHLRLEPAGAAPLFDAVIPIPFEDEESIHGVDGAGSSHLDRSWSQSCFPLQEEAAGSPTWTLALQRQPWGRLGRVIIPLTLMLALAFLGLLGLTRMEGRDTAAPTPAGWVFTSMSVLLVGVVVSFAWSRGANLGRATGYLDGLHLTVAGAAVAVALACSAPLPWLRALSWTYWPLTAACACGVGYYYLMNCPPTSDAAASAPGATLAISLMEVHRFVAIGGSLTLAGLLLVTWRAELARRKELKVLPEPEVVHFLDGVSTACEAPSNVISKDLSAVTCKSCLDLYLTPSPMEKLAPVDTWPE